MEQNIVDVRQLAGWGLSEFSGVIVYHYMAGGERNSKRKHWKIDSSDRDDEEDSQNKGSFCLWGVGVEDLEQSIAPDSLGRVVSAGL